MQIFHALTDHKKKILKICFEATACKTISVLMKLKSTGRIIKIIILITAYFPKIEQNKVLSNHGL